MNNIKNQNKKIIMEKLNLREILKNCPKGTKLYSTIYGEVEFVKIDDHDDEYPIIIKIDKDNSLAITQDGRLTIDYDGECALFPSKKQRDWNRFKIKKDCFNPETLKPFDKVLVSNSDEKVWYPELFGYYEYFHCQCINACWDYCIPFNEETEHLLGQEEEAPEFYRYWED